MLTNKYNNDNIYLVKAMTWTCPDRCKTYRELLVGAKKRLAGRGTTITADTVNCVREGPLYPARVADFYLQFGWNRGVIVHLIPFGDEGVFCFL